MFKRAALVLSLCLGLGAPGLAQEAGPDGPPMEYQAYGQSFTMPIGRELGLAASALPTFNSPWVPLMAAAWNQAGLLPYDQFMLLEQADVDVLVAVMRADVNGRLLETPQEKDFLSAQIWQRMSAGLDVSKLKPGENVGLGIIAQDDNSLFALSVQTPAVPPAAPDAQPAPAEQPKAQAMMVSSLTLVNGVPVLLGASSTKVLDAGKLMDVCRALTMYLRIFNGLSESGFFNPNLKDMVVAGRRLNVRLPEGSCVLSSQSARQAAALVQLESMVHGSFYPLLAYAPCDKLKLWGEGPVEAQLSHYGLLGVNLQEGQLKVLMEVDGKTLLANLREEQKGQPLNAAGLDKLDWQPVIAELPAGTAENLGHFGTDRHGAYWAAILKAYAAPGKPSRVLAGVLGVGAGNGLAITSLMYAPIDEPKVFSTLLKQQQSLLSNLNK